MAYYTYPVYVLASLIVLILCIIICIYLLHLYNCLRRRMLFIRMSNLTSDIDISAESQEYFPVSPTRVYRCLGYMILILPAGLHQTSNILLCQCKMVKFKKIFLLPQNVERNNTIAAKRKEIESPPVNYDVDELDDSDENNNNNNTNVSILSIDNTLDSEYILTTDQTINTHNDPFNSSCPICLDDFQLDEQIILLVCHHGYHKDCLRKSLRSSASCPYCKSKSNMTTYRVAEEMPLLWQNLARNSYGVSV